MGQIIGTFRFQTDIPTTPDETILLRGQDEPVTMDQVIFGGADIVVAVPEPASSSLLALATATGLLGYRRRRT